MYYTYIWQILFYRLAKISYFFIQKLKNIMNIIQTPDKDYS